MRASENSMSIAHKKPLKPDYVVFVARDLRKQETPAEKALWERLRGRGLKGMKFRRQAPFGRYIMDFYCKACSLCIEIDGSSHRDKEEYDSIRMGFLESAGIKALHFTNQDVLFGLENVIKTIERNLDSNHRTPSPVSGRRGKGLRVGDECSA